jgi:hypothetical protein
LTKSFFQTDGKGFHCGIPLIKTVEPPLVKRFCYPTVSSVGAAMLLAGCFSAEPFPRPDALQNHKFFAI